MSDDADKDKSGDSGEEEIRRLKARIRELEGNGEAPSEAPLSDGQASPVPVPAETAVEINPIADGDTTLRRLVQRIAMILQAEKIAIMFHQADTGELVAIPPAVGIDDAALEAFKIKANAGISGEVFKEGKPVIFHGANEDIRTRKDIVSSFKIRNGITVPLVIERRDEENRVVDRTTVGVLHALNKKQGEDFNEEDVRLLERMARNVGAIIASLQIYRKVVEENTELTQTFESLSSGLMLVSPSGRFSQVNASARTIFKFNVESLGKSFREVLGSEPLIQFIETGLSGVEPVAIEIGLNIHGSERVYSIQGAVVRSDDGKMLGFVTILNDITEAKNIDKMKSSFVAMASHELRTPLTAIKGFSQTLLDGVDDNVYGPTDQKEFLGIVVGECDRLRRLIDDLLNTARIEAGESLKPDYSEFELAPVADKAVRGQNQASVRHKVVLDLHPEGLPEKIWGDQDKLDQILTNLLNNAIKYSPGGGTVTVHVSRDGDYVKFGIEDQGIGIPADHLHKVFERFHRVDNEDNRKIYGTGLGLYLVKHLVEQVHMGKIWAESEVGKGSTFWVTIPLNLDVEEARKVNN